MEPSPWDRLRGDDSRVVLHFDYDSFYASVHEVANPSLRSLPLAIQQKQIIVTCNYEARRRGLYKLQLVTEARKACPDVVIVLGEDLDRFRDASKHNFIFLKQFVNEWGGRAERLGMDEVWLDATKLVEWNAQRLSAQHHEEAGRDGVAHDAHGKTWFALSKTDESRGFWFDKQQFAGNTWPENANESLSFLTEGYDAQELDAESTATSLDPLSAARSAATFKLCIASHLAAHVRWALEEQRGYSSSVGISVNKLLSKLVGGVKKPRGQTTLVGSYFTGVEVEPVATTSADDGAPDWKDIRRAELARLHGTNSDPASHQLDLQPDDSHACYRLFDGSSSPINDQEQDDTAPSYYQATTTLVPSTTSLPYDADVALSFLAPLEIGKIPGIGFKTSHALRCFALGRAVSFGTDLVWGQPKEHVTVSDIRHLPDMSAQLLTKLLSGPGAPKDIGSRVWNLLHGIDFSEVAVAKSVPTQISLEDSYVRLDTIDDLKREMVMLMRRLIGRMRTDLTEDGEWLARANTLRLTIRVRPPRRTDGTRERTFKRISRSAPMPRWVYAEEDAEGLAERVVRDKLVGMFRALHPEMKWDLSLVNVAAVNIVETETREGGDIRDMFWRKGDGNESGNMSTDAAEDGIEEEADTEDGGRADGGRAAEDADLAQNGAAYDAIPALPDGPLRGSEDFLSSQSSTTDPAEEAWLSPSTGECDICGAIMPLFAQEAHLRFHLRPG